ncbi:MAG: hypothetical protein JWO13_366 [Acidobacteriales bacterium]|nr:hypothetical protein [Terriglobales bacterium]
MICRLFAIVGLLIFTFVGEGSRLSAQETPPSIHQSLEDAWWTGPMLAPSAATLPKGHFLIEPYLYDVRAAGSHSIGSLTYALYGLADRFTVGMIPTVGYNVVNKRPTSAGIGLGDISLQAQYRLTQFRPGRWIPTTSINLQETFPTGKYDRLGDRPTDGLGSGVYVTTVSIYSQTYFWLPNGRILRLRFNLSEGFPGRAKIEGVSVYGTSTTFQGRANPSKSLTANASWEYSVTRRWVLALDATYRHEGNTVLNGYEVPASNPVFGPTTVRSASGSKDALGFAPAVEYSWKPNLGILLGVRVVPPGHNTNASVTPAIAVNFVH